MIAGVKEIHNEVISKEDFFILILSLVTLAAYRHMMARSFIITRLSR